MNRYKYNILIEKKEFVFLLRVQDALISSFFNAYFHLKIAFSNLENLDLRN
jgi:hypothetical protein